MGDDSKNYDNRSLSDGGFQEQEIDESGEMVAVEEVYEEDEFMSDEDGFGDED